MRTTLFMRRIHNIQNQLRDTTMDITGNKRKAKRQVRIKESTQNVEGTTEQVVSGDCPVLSLQLRVELP